MTDLIKISSDIISKGSKSFALAARLLDTQTYEHAIMLYAWCRYCDDQIDGQELGQGQQSPDSKEQAKRLKVLHKQTADAMAGKPIKQPIFQAFQKVFQEAEIPERYPQELLIGFEMDREKYSCDALEDTLKYSYHVAGTVGAMMAYIMGIRDEETLARAIDLGLAFQLTNICRDVLQDAADHRIYFPKDWLKEAGVPLDTESFVDHTPELFSVCLRLLNEADRYYQSAVYGIGHLPPRCAWGITAAKSVYQDIGRVLRARHDQAWLKRAYTTKSRKLWLALTSLPEALYAITVLRLKKKPQRDLWVVEPYRSGELP